MIDETQKATRSQAEYRAYIADLAAYNEGNLVGQWINLGGKTDPDIESEIQELLQEWPRASDETREEYAVHDWDIPFSHSFGEWPDWSEVVQVIEGHEEHGDTFTEYLDNVDEASTFEDHFIGVFESLENWAEQFINDCYDLSRLPDPIKYHIDYEGIARDMQYGGEIWTAIVSDGIAVFWNN